jgi:hypothetical protein
MDGIVAPGARPSQSADGTTKNVHPPGDPGRPLRAARFATDIEGREPLLVCAIEVYEVYKVIRRDLDEGRAVEAVSALRRATIAPVDGPLARLRRASRHRRGAMINEGSRPRV